jgi:hypothetical protein
LASFIGDSECGTLPPQPPTADPCYNGYKKNADNMDTPGGDLESMNVELDECASKCTERSDCMGFAYCPDDCGSSCYLKSTIYSLRSTNKQLNIYQKGKSYFLSKITLPTRLSNNHGT